MLEKGEAHELSRTAPKQLHHLRSLVQQGDAEAFANELKLDAGRTRQWFEQGFRREGYGADVIMALGILVFTGIVTTMPDREGHAHG